MGYDRKYGIVTTAFGDIPEDEPVIVFRGRDSQVPEMLANYLALCRAMGSPERHLRLVTEASDAIVTWQAEHPDRVRTPDSERSRAWLEGKQ